jgi:DNA polymerase-1
LGLARVFQWPLGADGRLRCMLSPFGSDTGRNQPSNSNYIFGAPAWMRRVISAPPGTVLAYVDFSSQEFALAAALAGDHGMIEDYACGDPYIGLAVRAGAVPPDATKDTHPEERAAFKVTTLAVGYGMGPFSLARQLGLSLSEAEHLIALHRNAYPRFWQWRQDAIDHVMTGGFISTKFGWHRSNRGPTDRATSIGNFLAQAGGGETLRLSVIALEEAGHRVVAPVHDAVLVELSEAEAETELAEVRRIMEQAGESVTDGLTIRTDADIILSGGHFEDSRGAEMWKLLDGTL